LSERLLGFSPASDDHRVEPGQGEERRHAVAGVGDDVRPGAEAVVQVAVLRQRVEPRHADEHRPSILERRVHPAQHRQRRIHVLQHVVQDDGGEGGRLGQRVDLLVGRERAAIGGIEPAGAPAERLERVEQLAGAAADVEHRGARWRLHHVEVIANRREQVAQVAWVRRRVGGLVAGVVSHRPCASGRVEAVERLVRRHRVDEHQAACLAAGGEDGAAPFDAAADRQHLDQRDVAALACRATRGGQRAEVRRGDLQAL
jgi:hypothetical protein